MPSSLWPDSATRKMYGQAGRKAAAQAKRYNEMLGREQAEHAKKIAALKGKVTEYQKLPWLKRLLKTSI